MKIGKQNKNKFSFGDEVLNGINKNSIKIVGFV